MGEIDFSSEITFDELPQNLQMIAEVVGVENTIKLSSAFRGCSLYIRNLEPILRRKRDAHIRQEYDEGTRVIELARKYKISQRSVEKILSTPEI